MLNTQGKKSLVLAFASSMCSLGMFRADLQAPSCPGERAEGRAWLKVSALRLQGFASVVTYLWSDARIGSRTSNHESVPVCRVRKQLLQKSVVLIPALVI